MNEKSNGRWVVPETPPRRLASQWDAIVDRLDERTRKKSLRSMLAVAGVVVAAGIAFVMIDRPWLDREPVATSQPPSAEGAAPSGSELVTPPVGVDAAAIAEGAVFDSAGQAVGVELADGSRIELSADSRVEVTRAERKDLRLALRSGTARFRVAPRPERQVTVTTDGVEVVAYGREFAMSRTEIAGAVKVTVRVLDGEVEVRRTKGGTVERRRIAAGESWSVEWATSARLRSPSPSPSASASPIDLPPPDEAETLFDAANEARRAGRHADAASYFEELLAKHPSDARGALAAFELGRLRMDRLNDLRGAARAFELAVSRSETGSLHEDATARLAETYDRLGDARRCREAREAYLSRYPDGVHARQMRRLCDTR
jgi:TolA-binding protein